MAMYLQRPVRGEELERVIFLFLRYTIPGTKIALVNLLVDVFRDGGQKKVFRTVWSIRWAPGWPEAGG
jgi:hypothetical protein